MPSPPAKFPRQVYVSLSEQMYGHLYEIAQVEGVSVSSLLREAADQYLDLLRARKTSHKSAPVEPVTYGNEQVGEINQSERKIDAHSFGA